MSVKQGYAFESEIQRSIWKLHKEEVIRGRLWLWKITDTHSYSAVKSLVGDNQFIMPKVPADYLMLYEGKPMFIEAKMSSRETSYDLDYIKDHQISNGIEVMAQDIPYYFLINKRAIDEDAPVGTPADFRIYIVNARAIQSLRTMLGMKGKHSIKWDVLEKYSDHYIGPSMRNTKDQTWDLSWLFTHGFDISWHDAMQSANKETVK